MTMNIQSAAPSLLLGSLLLFDPMFRKGNVWFGVHVTGRWMSSREAARAVMSYRGQIVAWTLVAMAIGLPGIALLLAGSLVAFVIGHMQARRNREEPSAARSAPLLPSGEGLPGGIAAAILPYLFLAAAAVWLNLHWNRIPERFPVHWDINGEPNRWGVRSWQSVCMPLVIGAVALTTLLLIACGILWGSPRGDGNTARFRRATLRVVMGVRWMLGVLFTYVGLMPILPGRIPMGLLAVILAGATLLLVAPLIRLGAQSGDSGDRSPDESWKLGMIYYNPEDTALMVQKRFGFGYTLNFANRIAWLIMGTALALPLLALALLKA